MKYFIEGRERKISFTKDNTAFYKSKGHNVDVTYMFKKTKKGLELRKKYLKRGGVGIPFANLRQSFGLSTKTEEEKQIELRRLATLDRVEAKKQKAAELNQNNLQQEIAQREQETEQEIFKQQLIDKIEAIPDWNDKLLPAINAINPETIQAIDRLKAEQNILKNKDYNYKKNSEGRIIIEDEESDEESDEYATLYLVLEDTVIKLVDILHNIAQKIDKLPNVKMKAVKYRGFYVSTEYHYYYYDKEIKLYHTNFKNKLIQRAWPFLSAKFEMYGERLSNPSDRSRVINERHLMITTLVEAAAKQTVKQGEGEEEEEGGGEGGISLSGGYKKTTKKPHKKTDKKPNKKADKNTTKNTNKKTKKKQK